MLNSIITMDKFESTINSIRDILRKEGITGMDSIKHCLVFVFMKYLTKEKCTKLDIDNKYCFDNIISLKDHNELQERIYVSGKECLVNILKKKNIFWVDYKLGSSENLKNILKKVNEVDINKLSLKADIVGIIYELHLKSGTSQAMRDLGQYFTNRQVIDYMIGLCEPKIKNKKTGEIETILDPSMGTGGFLTMAIKYLNAKNTGKTAIDWTVNKNNIYGFDIDDNVKSMSLLNTFIETGQLFDKTIIKHNSLEDDYVLDDGSIIDKVDIILANEPFGLKNIVHADCCDRIKNLKIRGTKAEPLFLQLMMLSLNENGRCAVIVPDGVLFNDANLHTETRKYLIENLNLKKVISLNGDFFLNTGVKSSILFFVNDGKTKLTEFSELVFDNGVIKENPIIKVDYKTIVKNQYSLFVNKYNIKEETKINGVKYMKLGDICEIKFGTRIKKNEVEVNDSYKGIKYPCYGGGNISFYMKEYNRDGLNVLISRFGVSENCVRITNNKLWLNDSGMTLHANDHVLQKYLNYILLFNQSNIYSLSVGACQKNINMDDLKKLEIPVPSIELQQQIVDILDPIYEQIETNNKSIKSYEKFKKGIVWANTMHNCESKKLGEIAEMKSGKFNSRDSKSEGKYPFYSSEANNPVGFIDDFCFDHKKYLILIKDGGAGAGKYGDQIGLGKVFKVNGKSGATSHQLAIVPVDDADDTINNYLYYYIQYIKNNIMDLAQYTTGLGTIRKSNIENIQIPIPSKQVQETIVKECEYWDEQIDRLKKENDKLKSYNIIELALQSESTNNKTTESIEETNPDTINEDSETEDQEPELIEIKGKTYFLEGTHVYVKTKSGKKGDLYGTYSNGKVKKHQTSVKPLDIEV